mgnify:CR=1 FL=1
MKFHLLTCILILTFLFASCDSLGNESLSSSEPSGSEALGGSVVEGSLESPPYSPTVTPLETPLGSAKGVPKELESVWEAWSLLNSDHVDRNEFEPDSFEEFAIKGLIDGVDDIHTSYIDPTVLQIEQEDLSGQFEGIGAHVKLREDGAILISSPMDGGPAEAAGIRAGDIVTSVDGESLVGVSLLEAVSMIRGPKGSTVVLGIRHLGDIDVVEISVVRDVIALPSVNLRSAPDAPIAHIRITEFKGDTAQRFEEMLKGQIELGAKGLVLDLRYNPGGYLHQVFEIADILLDKQVILIEERKDGELVWESEDGGIGSELPVVLLVNRYSASGSEIIMGAFQDFGRAPVVGEKTFGKGTVNVFRQLSNGGGLYMSVGRWYTPMRRQIEGKGLEPDYEISSRDPNKADVLQVEKAEELILDMIRNGKTEK